MLTAASEGSRKQDARFATMPGPLFPAATESVDFKSDGGSGSPNLKATVRLVRRVSRRAPVRSSASGGREAAAGQHCVNHPLMG